MIRAKLIVAFIICAVGWASAQVRVWHGTLTLPTYEEGPPDPNPPFDQFVNQRFNYSYTLRHSLPKYSRLPGGLGAERTPGAWPQISQN